MSEKTIRNLGIALLVIVALYGLLRWQQNRSYEPVKPKGFDFKKITKKDTRKITVKSKSVDYEIEKKGDKWQLGGLDVLEMEIDSLFDGLKKARVDDLITNKKSKFKQLEVDDEGGKLVTFETKKKKQSFIVGKSGPNGTDFYVRLPGKGKAYIASGSLGTVFAKEEDGWLDKEVLTLNLDEIEKVSYQSEEDSFEISKKKAQWSIEEDGSKEKADNDKVESLLSGLSMVMAGKIVSPDEKIDFSDSELITIYGKKGKKLADLKLKPKGKKEYYIKSSTKKLTYTIDDMTSKNIRKKAKDLR